MNQKARHHSKSGFSLIHYNVNTAKSFDCSCKKYRSDAIAQLTSIVQQVQQTGQILAPLPKPLEHYSVQITDADGAAWFDIFGTELLAKNIVVWDQASAERCWQELEAAYLRLVKQFGIVSLSRAPEKPSHLPWLATVFIPNQDKSDLRWLPDFEQCLALALIQLQPPEQPTSRGFGSRI
jgi:hypothetical protein